MPEDPLLYSLRQFIRKHRLIEAGEKIVAAVSGGVDSMVLLDCLDRLRSRLSITLAVAHFNHQLRGEESDDDEQFVRKAADERGLECHVDRGNAAEAAESHKLSVQDAARQLRYAFFNRLRTTQGFDKIATGHNADDNAETILLNLFRGAGVHGLSGIPVWRKDRNIIRPLLYATRDEIQQYAERHGLKHREDSTNIKTEYTRNFIRHNIAPLIRERINPNLTATLRRTGELFDQLEQYIQSNVARVLPEIVMENAVERIVLDLSKLREQPLFLQEQLLLTVAKQISSGEVDYNTVQELLDVSRADTGASCSLADDAVVHRDRDHLVFLTQSSKAPFSYSIERNKTYQFDGFSFRSSLVHHATMTNDPNVEYVDAASVKAQLTLRSWQEGDWFIPLGMRERKKVSDFFIDQKIPLFEKQSIPLLVSGDEIVWIVGKRLDDRHKVTPQTKDILRLEYIPHKHQ